MIALKYRIRLINGIIKAFSLKLKNKDCSFPYIRRLNIDKNVAIECRENGQIKIGIVQVESGTLIAASGKLTIGNGVFFNRNNNIICREKIDIQDNCFFGPNVCIYDHDHSFGQNGKTDGFRSSEVTIGENTWVGANCVILRGTHIGKNCIIGAGCVVKGSYPDGSLIKSSDILTVTELK